jgi:hypothetical protein
VAHDARIDLHEIAATLFTVIPASSRTMGQAGETGRKGDSKEDNLTIVVLPNAIFTKAETAGEVRKAREGDEPCAQTTAVSQPRKTEESEEEAEADQVSYVSLGLSTSSSGIMAVAT